MLFRWRRPQWQTWSCLCLIILTLWWGWMPAAQASVHVYRERPGQVTVRSRLSLRDFSDRAWQVIAFKRTQKTTLQGYYLRLVGFPGAVVIDQQRPATFIAPTGQRWQLQWAVDPQAKTLPSNVGQFDLAPLLTDIDQPLPLEVQLPLVGADPAEMAIAPFIVEEWLQVKRRTESPAPMGAPLRE
ncbi:MAG: DUF3122 domain-containing protein [Cyanobacteria bacterium P01_F01_bin.56]